MWLVVLIRVLKEFSSWTVSVVGKKSIFYMYLYSCDHPESIHMVWWSVGHAWFIYMMI